MSTLPLITIAIPTVNRLHYLKEAVQSAREQTYEQIEILIGQDPGADGPDESVRAWCEEAAGQDSRIRYQLNESRLGLAGNWNRLADTASGKYLSIVGDDDRLLPGFCKQLVNLVEPDKTLSFANHYVIDSQGKRLDDRTIEFTRSYGRDRLSPGVLSQPCIAAWSTSISMSASLMAASTVRSLRFKEDLNAPECEFFIRLAHGSALFAFTADYLSEYRIHPLSATASGLSNDRLVQHLLNIRVEDDVMPYKHRLLSSLLVNAVSRCLLSGRRSEAMELLASSYYPDNRRLEKLAQTLCCRLPGKSGLWLYLQLQALRNQAKRHDN